MIKSFKKQALQEKLSFDLIYLSNDDAVKKILGTQKPVLMIEDADQTSGLFQNVRINEQEDDGIYPPSAYKTRRDSYDENEFYIERF